MSHMTKKQFEALFKEHAIPQVIQKYEQDGVPDRPARREAWNDTVDAYIKDGKLSERAADWSHPRWLETYRPNPETTREGPESNAGCGPDELKVHRRGHTRKDGTRVAATTYCAEDQGEPGRTAHGAKGGTHSRAKGYKPWIKEEGSLGKGFLTKMSFADQKKAVKRAFTSEKKQHRGDYEAAYRSTLGKIMVLNRSTELRRKYGDKITRIRDWFVKEYGAESKRWPEEARRAANIRRLKNACTALPSHMR